MKPVPAMPLVMVPAASITTPSSPLRLKRASMTSLGRKCISFTASATVSGFGIGAQTSLRAEQAVDAFGHDDHVGSSVPPARSVFTPITLPPLKQRSVTVVSKEDERARRRAPCARTICRTARG